METIKPPIKPPYVYFEWVKAFDMLVDKTDDAEVLSALQQGTIVWQPDISGRFSNKLVDSINARMKVATDKLHRDMGNARGQEGSIAQAMLAMRKEIAFLSQIVSIPAIPEENREQYNEQLRSRAGDIQSAIEESARADRTGKLESIVRNHKITAF